MSRPRIGDLRHRVVIEQAVRTPDGGGGVTETWTAVAEVWAAVAPVGGDERPVSERLSGIMTHRVHIRHRAGLEPAMRLRLGTRIFEILAVLDVDERRRFLHLACRERDL